MLQKEKRYSDNHEKFIKYQIRLSDDKFKSQVTNNLACQYDFLLLHFIKKFHNIT